MALIDNLLRMPTNVSSKNTRLCLRLLFSASLTLSLALGSAANVWADPIISVTPDSLHEDLLTGETALRTLTVSNSGTTALNFNVSFSPAAGLPSDSSSPFPRLARGTSQSLSFERIAEILDNYELFSTSVKSNSLDEGFLQTEMNVEESPLLSKLQSFIEAVTDTSIIFFDDFEGDTTGWEHYEALLAAGDQWVKSSARSSSGSSSWHVSQHASAGSDALQTPTIDLTSFDNATLSFKHWYNFDDCSDPSFDPDGGIVEVSTNNGVSWVQIFPVGGYPFTLDDICANPLRFFEAYSHDGQGPAAGQFIPAVFDLSAFVGSAIQIRFHAGWDCGNCASNEGWYIDDVTISTENFVGWLSSSPQSGTVAPGSSVAVDVIFDATGLIGGDYLADITFTSDDPLTPELVIPASMAVTGAPDIALSESTLLFPALFVGSSFDMSLIVQNIGTDVLSVSSLLFSNSAFSSPTNSLILSPGESQLVMITFAPSVSGALMETLTLVSDDPIDPSVVVTLNAEALDPPIVGVTPDSLDDSLLTGETALHALTIGNTGGSDLNFELRVRGSGFAGLITSPGNPVAPTQTELLETPLKIKRHPTANDSTFTNFRLAASGTYTGTQLSIGISDYGEILPFQFPVGNGHLAFGSFISGYTVIYELAGVEKIAYAEFQDRSSLIPISFTEITNDATKAVIQVVLRTSDNALEISRKFTFIKSQATVGITTDIRNISGGTVDSVDFKIIADIDVDGEFNGNTFNYDASLNMAYASQVNFMGIAGSIPPDFRDLDGWNDRFRRLTDGEIVVGPATFDGLALLHYQRGSLPSGALTSISTAFGAGSSFSDLQTAIAQGLNQANWLELVVTEGTIPAASSQNVDVTFNATGLIGGDYFANIAIISNDSTTPELVVPAHLFVTGAPDIAVADSVLTFPALFLGSSFEISFLVENNGTDVLSVSSLASSNSVFSSPTLAFTLAPGVSQLVTVTFAPTAAGVLHETLTITSDDPDEPILVVDLVGEGLNPPIISVVPDSLDDSLFTGGTATQTLTIENTGGSDLNYELTLSAGSFVGSPGSMNGTAIPKNPEPARAPLFVELHPTANDSANSVFRLPAAGTYTGTQLSFGVSDFGEILPFQFPVGNGHLAFGSFISGYLVAYRLGGFEKRVYAEFQNRSGLVPVSFTESTNNLTEAVIRVVTRTTDNALEITRTITFLKSASALSIETNIENISGDFIEEVDFKILADLDADGSFNNTFDYDSTHNMIHASSTHFVGIAGATAPDFRDLNGWASLTTRITQQVLTDGPALFDGLAMLHYKLGNLAANNSASLTTGFGAGNTLAELQSAIENSVNMVNWLKLTSTSGTIPAGSSAAVPVTFDAAGLFGGDYFADIIINSNDSANLELRVPAHLFVTGAPDITVSDSALDFDSLFIGASVTRAITIGNVGTDVLSVTSITSTQTDYTVDISAFSLNPGGTKVVTLTFAPTSAGVIASALNINSNDGDEPITIVLLSGKGLIPPEIAVAPDSLFDSLLTGEVSIQQVTVTNNGGSDLFWEASVVNASVSLSSLYTLTVPDPNAPSLPTDTSEVSLGAPQGAIRTTALQATLADLTGVKIFFDRSHNQQSSIFWSTIISDLTSRGATVTENVTFITPSLLQNIDVYWSTDLFGFWSTSEINALTTWAQAGGSILLSGDNSGSMGGFNALLTGLGTGITYSSQNALSGFTTNIVPHETTSGVSNLLLANNVARLSSISSPAALLVSDFNGIANTAYSEVVNGRVIAMSDQNFASDRIGFADNQLFANQVFDWLASSATWIRLDTTGGILAAGQSQIINTTLDATGLFGGDYLADIEIVSNDPVNASVSTSINLHVTGIPDIVVTPLALDFGSLFVGLSDSLSLLIKNNGTDGLHISGISSSALSFTSEFDTLNLAPETEKIVQVFFSATAATVITGLLDINSNDPDQPTITVNLQGEGLVPPDIAVTPNSISEILFPTDSIIKPIVIFNTGGSDLLWNVRVEGLSSVSTGNYTLTPPETYYPGNANPQEQVVPSAPARTSALSATLKDLTGVIIRFDRGHGGGSSVNWSTMQTDLRLRGATVTDNFLPLTESLLSSVDVYWITDLTLALSVAERLAIKNWVNAGGGLLLEGDNNSSVAIYNALLNPMGAGIEFSTIDGAGGVTSDIALHSTTKDVTSIILGGNIAHISSVTAPAGPLVTDVAGKVNSAFSEVSFGRIVAMADEVFLNDRIALVDNQLFGNQVFDWLAKGSKWLRVDSLSGVVAAGESIVIKATLNANQLLLCSDSGQIVISSNDPDSPEISIPTTLVIDRLPQCIVPNDTTIFYCETLEVRLPAFGIDSCDLGGVVCEIISGPGALELGEWIYSPTGDEVVTVAMRCTDSRGNVCNDSFTVTFDVNEPPSCALPPDTTIFLCQPGTVRLPFSAEDPDGNLASVSLVGGPGTLENNEWVYFATSDHFTLTRLQSVDSCGVICENLFRVDFDINSPPTLTCPPDTTIKFNTITFIPIAVADPELASYEQEEITFSLAAGSAEFATINSSTGLVTLAPFVSHICEHTVNVVATDFCGAADTCSFTVCVNNTPPVITCDSIPTSICWGQNAAGLVSASDIDNGPVSPIYTLVSFDGPGAVIVDPTTGEWNWQTDEENAFIGNFNLCISASDGAILCDPCSPHNADTCCLEILVTPTYRVTIETVNAVIQGGPVNVEITLADTYESYPLAGYDFLIDYDASALSITGATEGAFNTGNDWEYFTYRFGVTGNCGAGCPSGKFRLVALANTNNGLSVPSGFTNISAGSSVLANLHFQVSNDRTLECNMAPISWSWFDCGDNAIASVTGDSLFISRYIYGSAVVDGSGSFVHDFGDGGASSIHDASATFPTNLGAPSQCDVSGGPGKAEPIRKIDFANGGAKIACADSIDARGDINLNGLSNEIADAVVFTSYFVQGLSAFSVNADGQTAATEINGDGIPLSVSDLVYLIRVIVGDAIPLPKLNHYAQSVSISNRHGEIGADSELGAALFVFAGAVEVELLQSELSLSVGLRQGNTYALVTPVIGSGEIGLGRIQAGAVLQADGALLSVEAADYYGSALRVNTVTLPTKFAVRQNYPNPFNPSTVISFDMPKSGSYSIVIYNVAGQKIREFAGESGAGVVEVKWEAANSASGIYFYRVKVGSNSVTRKMLLLK